MDRCRLDEAGVRTADFLDARPASLADMVVMPSEL